ncbi:MAG: DUF262 domain-containing protein [Chromatiaceae bacterium]|nr:DUF262 domain-containing protein [Chromatiaceae bacterium]
MKATEAKLLKFLKDSPQFVIPIYQRTYSWTEKECRQLWDDILRAGKNDEIPAHFIGSVVYVEQGLYSVSSQSPLLVIDGQQRLTTVTLLIAALAEALADKEPIEDFSPRKLRNYYLVNPEEEGERHFKLILSQTDKPSLIAILNDSEQPTDYSIRITENFRLFQGLLAKHKDDLPAVCQGVAKLMIVDISLSRDQDNPQLIFESMNSTGRELSQADLIRNYVLMGLEPELQTKLYEKYWRPMELAFGQEAYSTHFDPFMRHYLTVRTGEIPNVREVYEAFKKYASSPKVSEAGVEALVAEVRAYAGYFCAMALGKETAPELSRAFHDLRELKVDVAYPFLLELYQDYVTGMLPAEDFAKAARLVESYVFRRAVCAIPTNSLNKTFATLGKSLKKDRYLESLEAAFLLLPSYRRFPKDDEFMRELKSKDLYGFRSRSYWLRRLENHGRKERVAVDEYTIEHILPQCDNVPDKVPAAWREALGDDWLNVWETYRHTLGNLTLTGYNSEYSNRTFTEKRNMEGGFADSPLRLNKMLRTATTWNKVAIEARADQLASEAVAVWKAPSLDGSVLEAYKPVTTGQAAYTIEDHPHLASGPVREMFEAFRKEVLAIDPCVSEEFLKLYVAYKAETNFVDVVPQAKRLRLSLNMGFPEIDDPKGLCKDVSGLGRWGNGDVEVALSSLDELPYVLGLVQQSFEKQMGDGATA